MRECRPRRLRPERLSRRLLTADRQQRLRAHARTAMLLDGTAGYLAGQLGAEVRPLSRSPEPHRPSSVITGDSLATRSPARSKSSCCSFYPSRSPSPTHGSRRPRARRSHTSTASSRPSSSSASSSTSASALSSSSRAHWRHGSSSGSARATTGARSCPGQCLRS